MFEVGDKVQVSSEIYVGPAYIRRFHRDGAYVSIDRFGKEFFMPLRYLTATR